MKPEIVQFNSSHFMALYDPAIVGLPLEQALEQAKTNERVGPAWTVLFDGKPVGAGGMGIYQNGEAHAWLLPTPELKKHWRWMVEMVVLMLMHTTKEYQLEHVQIVVRKDDKCGKRFAEWLGFHSPKPIAEYGLHKGEFYQYTRGNGPC